MKVYLAGRYGRREELAGYAEALRAHDYLCTASWLTREPEFSDDGVTMEGEDAALRRAAWRDLADVRGSDVLVLFGEEPGQPNRAGRMVEMGAALDRGMRCIIVGPRENLFAWAHGVLHVATWAECLETLHSLRVLHTAGVR